MTRENENSVGIAVNLANFPEKKNVRLSKPLIKLMKKIDSVQKDIPTPMIVDSDSDKVTERDMEFYHNPIGITKVNNVIEFGTVNTLSVYDHLLIQKGDYSKNYIYQIFELVKRGIISEATLKEMLRGNNRVYEQAFNGYCATIVVDLVAAYISYMMEIIHKDFPEFDTVSFAQLLINKVIVGSMYVRTHNASLYEEIYSKVYSDVTVYKVGTKKNADSVLLNYNNFAVNMTNTVVITVYDNIHMALCNAIGIYTNYETVQKIMDTIVNDCLTSLHDALTETLHEIVYKLVPIFMDHEFINDYTHNNRKYEDYYYDEEIDDELNSL